MYRPQNIKEIDQYEDWPIGMIDFVEDEVNLKMMYLVFGREDIWKDSLKFVYAIHFPEYAIIVVQEQAP